jgi:hypothetical protein
MFWQGETPSSFDSIAMGFDGVSPYRDGLAWQKPRPTGAEQGRCAINYDSVDRQFEFCLSACLTCLAWQRRLFPMKGEYERVQLRANGPSPFFAFL